MKLKPIVYALLILLALAGCNKEFDYITPLPTVSFVRNVDAKLGPRGTNVRIRLDLQAVGELSRLRVSEAIQGGDFTELTSINMFPERFRVPDFEFLYRVDTIQYPSLQNGDDIKVKFELFDKLGNATNPIIFNITVGGTFIETPETINGTPVIALRRPQGALITLLNDEDFIFRSGQKYLIQGVFEIEEGLSIRMEAGAEVYAETGAGEVAVFRVPTSARLLAEGTSTQPIVMTSDKILKGQTPEAGDWQGLDVFGASVINAVTGESSAPNDDSGIYRYLRVEYGGGSAATVGGVEPQVRFSNVGAGTLIDYVQSFKSAEIGIRFNGGNVPARHLIVTDATDHSYRFDDIDGSPYRGMGQFWIAENSGIDLDGEALRFSDGAGAMLANITFLGPGQSSGLDNSAARVRNTAGPFRIFNAIFAEFPNTGFRAQNNPNPSTIDAPNTLGHSYLFNISGSIFRDNAAAFSGAEFNNTVGTAINGIGVNAYVPSQSVSSTFNPNTLNSWFTAALFVGAVENTANDWTSNGNWCKNADGSIR